MLLWIVPRQLMVELYHLKQEPGKSIDDFFFHTCNICGIKFHYMNQHGLCMQCPKFHEYREQLKKISVLPSWKNFQIACTRRKVYKSSDLGLVTRSWQRHPFIHLQHLITYLQLDDLTLNMIILTSAPSGGFETI